MGKTIFLIMETEFGEEWDGEDVSITYTALTPTKAFSTREAAESFVRTSTFWGHMEIVEVLLYSDDTDIGGMK